MADVYKCCAGKVTWSEVEHWLWPVLSHRWATWRQDRLGLPAMPFCTSLDDASSHEQDPGRTTPNLESTASAQQRPDNKSSQAPGRDGDDHQKSDNSQTAAVQQRLEGSITQAPGKAGDDYQKPNSGSSSDGQTLPASMPLLYGFSESVIQRPGYWPGSVHCCGFWLQQQGSNVGRL